MEVNALCSGLGGNHDRRLVTEVVHQRRPHVRAGRAADTVGARVPLQPMVIDIFRFLVVVRAIEQQQLARKLSLLKNAEEVFLCSSGLCENKRLLLNRGVYLVLLRLGCCGKPPAQSRQQHFTLRVFDNGLGECVEFSELGHLLSKFS